MAEDPQAAATALVSKIVAQPHLTLTEDDAAILLAAPDRTLMMDKVLTVHFNRLQDYRKALPLAQRIQVAEPNSENTKNVAHLMRSAGRVQDAIRFLEEQRTLIEPILLADMLCMMNTSAGNLGEARRQGTISLTLKDQVGAPAPPIQALKKPFDPKRPRRNVIAFSLWGQDQRYLDGAVQNAIVSRHLYPGWSVRVYLDHSVPGEYQEMLRYHGADLRSPPEDWPGPTHGLFWRFLVEDDEDVDYYLIRDADSVLNIKERAAVEDWLLSGRSFHVMRDFPSHCELILAGMWGAQRGYLGQMRARVDQHIATTPKRLNHRTTDQEFLRHAIWPIVRQDALVHDESFDFGDTVPFRKEFALPPNRHIGQNDWVHRRPATKG
ncbi:MAG: hypothetical protein AAF674_22195 [Pseudomonadota bacterium]